MKLKPILNKYWLVVFSLIWSINSVFSQELNCQVTVINMPSLSVSANDLEVFEDMKNNIYEFMNNTQWTKDNFEIEERIDCNLIITISEINSDTYTGSMQIQSSRPVFNTSYNTTVFSYNDGDFNVSYLRNTSLIFSVEQYRNNLTSLLAFYAYLIIGYDYDTFSKEGGTEYFETALQIASMAKSSGDSGWEASSGKRNNRYWIIQNALGSLYSPIREAFYSYHRLGLDVMYNDISAARTQIIESLKLLDRVQRSRPGSVNISNFMLSKSDELVNIFSQAQISEKNTVINLLKRLDPTNSSKYQTILN